MQTRSLPLPVLTSGHKAEYMSSKPAPSFIGSGSPDLDLSPGELREILEQALLRVAPGTRVLAVIPDKTRDDNTDLLFPMISEELAGRSAGAFDALVAQGTHPAMTLLGTVFDHHWDRPSDLLTLGTLSRARISSLTGGLMAEDVPVQLNAH